MKNGSMRAVPLTPFTILTGFLGAGKTTALNRLLGAAAGKRVAVLVNELGRIHIDRDLILGQDGDILELSGGCVCCKLDLQRDLWTGVVDVAVRSRADQVVLETTGVAEPDALLDLPKWVAEKIEIAGVITVVDAQAGIAQLARHEEARAQVVAADRILLSKLDVATPAEAEAIHRRLDELAPTAERASFPASAEGTASLLSWILDVRPRSARPATKRPHVHGQLVSATYVADEPLAAAPLLATLERLGDRLVRAKGFVHLAGDPRRFYLERAGAATTLSPLGEWTGPPRSEIVLIGEGLDEPTLRRALWACRAA
jgi:G3E family GTPase